MTTTTIYKGMSRYDEQGNLINEVKRPMPFPAFNGDEQGIDVIGFFTKDPQLAQYYAANHGDNGIVRAFSLKETDKTCVIDATFQKAGDVQFGETGKPFRDAVRSGQFDVIELKNTDDEGDVIVVLNADVLEPKLENRRRLKMK